MRRAVAVPVLALALGVGGVAAPGVAFADHLSCGDVLTEDTVLDADLQNCPGDGLILAANGITLDLNGFTIDGDETSGALGGGAGVRVRPGATDTAVVGPGLIQEFSEGVVLDSNSGGAVIGVSLDRNTRGIALANASDALIQGNTVTNSWLDGIRLDGFGTRDNTVKANRLKDNVFGLAVSSGASGNLLVSNTISGSRHWGIAFFGGATDNTAEHNHALFNGEGVHVSSGSTGTELVRNVANHNAGNGFTILDQHAFLRGNVANRNGGYGIYAPNGYADGGGNVTRNNGTA
jgi:parallel beta-helix repeat protein